MSSTSQPDPSVIQSLDRFSAAVQEQVETDVAGHAALKKIRREHAQFHHLETRVLSSLCGPLLLQLRAAKVDGASQIKALEARWHELMARGPPLWPTVEGCMRLRLAEFDEPAGTRASLRATLGVQLHAMGRHDEAAEEYCATARALARKKARLLGMHLDVYKAYTQNGRGLPPAEITQEHAYRECARARYQAKVRARERLGPGVPVGRWLHAALAPLSKALRLNPTSEAMWSMAADAYHELSREDFSQVGGAVVATRRAMALRPSDVGQYTNLGKVHNEAGAHDEALDAYRRAARLDPSWRHAYLVSESLLTGGRHAEARESYARLVRRPDAAGRPELADAYNHLAVSILGASDEEGGLAAAFGESLDLDEAFAASAEAIALSPACTARHAHNYYQVAASLYLRAGELDYATAALWPVSAGDDTPRAARMVDAGFRALAWGHARGGRPAEARAALAASRRLLTRMVGSSEGDDELRALGALALAPPPPPAAGLARWPAAAAAGGGSVSGVIVYVCCADEREARDLVRSVSLLHRHFNKVARYPVLIFHDFLNASHTAMIRDAAGDDGGVTFEWLDAQYFDLPASAAAYADRIPPKIRGYGMGYRHMCRFFCGPLWSHPAVAAYEYVWRLDSDSFVLGPPTTDPFAQLEAANASYGWLHAYADEQMFVTGLWDTVAEWMRAREIDEWRVQRWVPLGRKWEATPMCFATNVFVARRDFFASEGYRSLLEALDAAGGFYLHRWGDACVHMLAVAALLPPERVVRLSGLPYWHQGTVVLPAEVAPVLPALLDDDGPTPVVAHDVALATGSGVDAALQEGRRAGRNWYRWGAVLCDALRCAEEPGAGDEETWEGFMEGE